MLKMGVALMLLYTALSVWWC